MTPPTQATQQGQGSSPGQPGQGQGQGVLPPNFIQDLVQQIVRQTGKVNMILHSMLWC